MLGFKVCLWNEKWMWHAKQSLVCSCVWFLGLYKEKTVALCSVDRKAALWIAKHWEIKGAIGQQVLSRHKIESPSVLQHKKELSCHCWENSFLSTGKHHQYVYCEWGGLWDVCMCTNPEHLDPVKMWKAYLWRGLISEFRSSWWLW